MKFSARLEYWRIQQGDYASKPGDPFGAFLVPCPHSGRELRVIASNGNGEVLWEHVSVSLPNRTPNWQEMCFIKELFWSDDEWVVQFHPAKAENINCYPHCLHLWRPIDGNFPKPPRIAV